MRQHRRTRLLVAILSGLALVAAACGDDDDDDAAAEDGEEEPTGEALVLGHMWPETGDLAPLGPPQRAGVDLAIEDINAAGGVLGAEVTLLQGDEAGDTARAQEEASRLLGEGAHAIIGAASSDMSQSFIQTLFDNEVAQCSPSNTSPAFSDQDNAAFYFRTVPPDEAVTPVIVDEVIADGAQTVAITGRADDYGEALVGLLEEGFTETDVEVQASVSYDPETTTFDAEVGEITAGNPDAIVVIGFAEGWQLVGSLIEAGVSGDQLYAGDGMFDPGGPELVNPDDPGVIDGMKAIGASGGAEFNERLSEEVGSNLIYGGQAYDCAIVMALSAHAAGTTDSSVFIDEAGNVTSGGTECTTFEECRDLLDEGEDIDYIGVSGPLDLDDAGDPTFGRYAVGQYTADGEFEIVAEQDVDLETL